jgi:hypothetical protein
MHPLNPLNPLNILALAQFISTAPTNDFSDLTGYLTPPLNSTSTALDSSTTPYGHCQPGKHYCFREIVGDLRTSPLRSPLLKLISLTREKTTRSTNSSTNSAAIPQVPWAARVANCGAAIEHMDARMRCLNVRIVRTGMRSRGSVWGKEGQVGRGVGVLLGEFIEGFR